MDDQVTGAKVYDIQKRGYQYAVNLVRFLEGLPKDYIAQTLGKQLLRSGTSIGANIIEAQAASSRKDFANFYNYSLKSSNESKFWLNLLKDAGKVSVTAVEAILQETDEIARILAASLITLRGKKNV